MDVGASDEGRTSPKIAPRGHSHSRIVIGFLVGVVGLTLAGGWLLFRDFEDTFSCPPQVWAEGLAADIEALLPSSAIWTDPTISDCDDRRAVTAESVPVTGTESDLAALQTGVAANARRSGWSGLEASHCLEREIDGLATRLWVDVIDDIVSVQASRGAC